MQPPEGQVEVLRFTNDGRILVRGVEVCHDPHVTERFIKAMCDPFRDRYPHLKESKENCFWFTTNAGAAPYITFNDRDNNVIVRLLGNETIVDGVPTSDPQTIYVGLLRWLNIMHPPS